MEIEVPEDSPPGWTIVVASGELDVTSVRTLREQLSALTTEGADRLIIDIDALDFVDSTGLGVLVDATDEVRSDGGDLRLVCTDARLRHLISVAGVEDRLTLAESVAVASGQATEM